MKFLRSLACWSLIFAAAFATAAAAQQGGSPWSRRAADAAIARWPNGNLNGAGAPAAWVYDLGTLLDGVDAVWLTSNDPRYLRYIQSSMDALVTPEGAIPGLKPDEHQLDNILLGRQLILLYGVTQDKKYLKAATFLYDQLAQQPRTPSGGYWHKQRYPNQMWLDGLYMAEPFRAEYAALAHHPEEFKDITQQFVLMEQHARDPKTGLLYHGWDESKQERWANKQTGLSQQFWGRAIGWYMMALVDTLDAYPENDPGRTQLLAILQRESAALARVQDRSTGLWYLVLDKPKAQGNYFESSASCMFVYALAKAVRRGYLPPKFLENAERGYQGILKQFVTVAADGDVTLSGTIHGAGLGGNPYRDGSYDYYIGEKVVSNDAKGVGAFLLASTEIENAGNAVHGRDKVVLLDGWFNSQQRTDAFGQPVIYHYKWKTWDNPGYSIFGHIFQYYGARTQELDEEPTFANLKDAHVYIVVPPDNLDKNPHPHYANAEDAKQIAAWVKAGGVLVIMENDTSYADLDHFNTVAEKFGIHFNSVLRKHVEGTNWEQGKIAIDGHGPIFHQPHTIFVKDVCTISVSKPASAVLEEGGDIYMAAAKYGKGTVYAMVDPWLYNEYIDGRKLPVTYDNYAAGSELVRWILDQAVVRPRKP
jgi:unsaturated rhamnogalacturonyl hydrolase